MSFGGALGGLARTVVTNYQAQAKDPPAFIPAVVDQALVLFQHTQSTAGGIYNLWGQVPVKSAGPLVHYYNLTDMGVTHSGKTGINYWFRDFIAPTLGNQAPLLQELQLNGQIDNAQSSTITSNSQSTLVDQAKNARANRVYGPAQIVQTNQPEFSGTAAPGSIIRLGLGPANKPMDLTLAGATTPIVPANGHSPPWHPLRNGQYRTLVTAFSRSLTTRPAFGIVPTQPLGRLVVERTAQVVNELPVHPHSAGFSVVEFLDSIQTTPESADRRQACKGGSTGRTFPSWDRDRIARRVWPPGLQVSWGCRRGKRRACRWNQG